MRREKEQSNNQWNNQSKPCSCSISIITKSRICSPLTPAPLSYVATYRQHLNRFDAPLFFNHTIGQPHRVSSKDYSNRAPFFQTEDVPTLFLLETEGPHHRSDIPTVYGYTYIEHASLKPIRRAYSFSTADSNPSD